ncbi:hypothetical protein [Arenimonas oryziterrae]|uniref:LysM domain-containing protein n=1 Tax=Arenimonas oryziterrae DSM 21050 = YC6267 TaxID=1121015 RepID=A0A091AT72_9GAMM|nr:hypothetical protein [Arenimonas oryziterrae]KFN42204.1 hypothetical protein N789_14550 [Arenimonas oryziterrae DSM 21050 = YC6267]
MFLKNSRYSTVPTVTAIDGQGREVQAVSLRRLPTTPGERTVVRDHDQLDVMSQRRTRDGTRFWHIADANSELEANTLVETSGRAIDVPVK